MAAVVVLDAGTGGGKCVIFDERGRALAVHREAWGYSVSADAGVPFLKTFSFDAPAFWGLLCRSVQAALAAAGVEPAQVAGVVCTSQREGCVFLDAQGREIYAGPNLDARGFNEGVEVVSRLGERLYQITGHSAPFIFPLARYLWFRKHGNGSVAHILMLNDWLTYRLSREMASEPSNAAESMLFDVRERRWSDEILEAFQIPKEILPPLLPSGELVGKVDHDAAVDTGLLEGTPVFIGGADTQCSLLGAAVIEPHDTGVTLGTTTPVQTVVAEPIFDPEGALWAGCHVVEGRWVLESNAGDTGDAYLWLLDLISGGLPREQMFALAERLAAASAPSPSMLFVGPSVFNLARMNFRRPGGILFPFPAMHVRPDRAALVRGFLDNLAFALRANLEQLAEVTGRGATQLSLSGGMSRSDAVIRTIVDVLGRPVRLSEEPESAALGCAIFVTAAANGRNIETAVRAMVRHREVSPDPRRHEQYEVAYRKWREIDARLDEISL